MAACSSGGGHREMITATPGHGPGDRPHSAFPASGDAVVGVEGKDLAGHDPEGPGRLRRSHRCVLPGWPLPRNWNFGAEALQAMAPWWA